MVEIFSQHRAEVWITVAKQFLVDQKPTLSCLSGDSTEARSDTVEAGTATGHILLKPQFEMFLAQMDQLSFIMIGIVVHCKIH